MQARYSVKEIGPRVVVGFLAVNLTLILPTSAIAFANAATRALLGQGVDPESAADTLTTLVMSALNDQGIFVIFIGLAFAAALVALLVTNVVRVALTVILIAGGAAGVGLPRAAADRGRGPLVVAPRAGPPSSAPPRTGWST